MLHRLGHPFNSSFDMLVVNSADEILRQFQWKGGEGCNDEDRWGWNGFCRISLEVQDSNPSLFCRFSLLSFPFLFFPFPFLFFLSSSIPPFFSFFLSPLTPMHALHGKKRFLSWHVWFYSQYRPTEYPFCLAPNPFRIFPYEYV